MKILFVEKPQMEIRYQRSCLLLYAQGKRISSVPLAQLETIVLAPHVNISAGVLGLVAEKQVNLIVINIRYPERVAMLSTSLSGNSQRRQHQYQLTQNNEFRLSWALLLIQLKILRQYRLLLAAKTHRQDLHYYLTKSCRQIKALLSEIQEPTYKPSSLAELRGKEGAAASIYFRAYSHLFASTLAFKSRQRRPPPDPVNAILSLSYTLFYHQAAQALTTHGLDPALGCLHDLAYNRDSLACDLLEPLRSLLDRWVYQLFQQGVLRPEDFTHPHQACLLNSAGKKRYYQAYRKILSGYQKLLRRYARLVANIVDQHADPSDKIPGLL